MSMIKAMQSTGYQGLVGSTLKVTQARGRGYAGIMGDGRRIDLEEQCDDEGDQSDTGIGDTDGLMEQVSGYAGYGTCGFAK